jgi:hypothetical protein
MNERENFYKSNSIIIKVQYTPVTLTSSVSNAAMIFFVHVSTTDVSAGGDDDMKRAVNDEGATYLVPPIMVAAPLVEMLQLCCCAVNERARELSSIKVARRRRDFIVR